nr:hypothetical protein [Tanacetum cinerariifolium]
MMELKRSNLDDDVMIMKADWTLDKMLSSIGHVGFYFVGWWEIVMTRDDYVKDVNTNNYNSKKVVQNSLAEVRLAQPNTVRARSNSGEMNRRLSDPTHLIIRITFVNELGYITHLGHFGYGLPFILSHFSNRRNYGFDFYTQGNLLFISNTSGDAKFIIISIVYTSGDIKCLRTTRVKKCDDFSGPVYGFNFKPFTDLLQERQDSTFSYDLIGDITSCGKIETQKEKKGKLKGNKLQNVTLWGAYADQLDEYIGDRSALGHKVNLADIKYIAEIKSVVVVATIKVIERDNKWYYLACDSCNRIVDEKTVDKKDSDYGELKKQVVFVCSNKECGEVTNVRYKVASKLLNCTVEEFIREIRKNEDMDHFPEHFNILLGCTYAFKVDITKYCLDNHKFVYPVATYTDNGSIINKLEAMKSTQDQLPSNSEQSLSLFLSPPTMGKLKGALSGTEESSSFGYQESNDTPPLKRSVEVIHVEDISDLSSNKK